MLLVALIAFGVVAGRIQSSAKRDGGRTDLLSRSVQAMVMPIARPVSAGADTVRDFLTGIVKARSLAAQNRTLKSQLDALSLYSERLDLMQEQIDDLRRLLALKSLPGKQRINLDVIGIAQAEGILTLNGGAEYGLEPGMPVINGDGLVGIVQTVSKGECHVALLTTYGVKLGGVDLSRTPPQRGLISGQGSTTLTMMMWDPNAPIASGDNVVTGGLSDRIPYGLIIGRIVSVADDQDYGTRRATIIPAVNVGSMIEVQVLK